MSNEEIARNYDCILDNENLCYYSRRNGWRFILNDIKYGLRIKFINFNCFFIVTLQMQLYAKKHKPLLYWSVILATSTAGTTMSDFMDRTLGLGYATGSLILITFLTTTFILWRRSEKSVSINEIHSFRGELFYWIAILFSNTLGTALGDFLADNSGLGFFGGTILIGSLLILIILAHYFLKVSAIVLFWLAFVLTRPFGATFGDLLTKSIKKGGLNFGTVGSSLILFTILMVLITIANMKNSAIKKANSIDKK